MHDTLIHYARIVFWGAAFAFPVCLILTAVAWRSIDMLEGD